MRNLFKKNINKMSIQNIYTSVACNQKTGSADWGKNKHILYAACNAVALLNPEVNIRFPIRISRIALVQL